MASMADVVAEAGRDLGLMAGAGPSNVFGEVDGYMVQLTAGKSNGTDCVVGRIRYGNLEDEAAVRAGLADADTDSVGMKREDVKVEGDQVVYTQRRGFVRALDAQSIRKAFEVLFAAVKSSSQPRGAACRLCGSADAAGPRLLNGVVDRVCDECLQKLHEAVAEARAAYEAVPTRVALAVASGIVLALAGAISWAGIGIATNSMFWLVAIGMGLLIGFGVTKAAGKRGAITQTLCIVFTLASVLLGQLMFIGYYVNRQAVEQGGSVDWVKFILAAPGILVDTGGDTLFAVGGGLLGAVYAARKAGKPKMEISVEG